MSVKKTATSTQVAASRLASPPAASRRSSVPAALELEPEVRVRQPEEGPPATRSEGLDGHEQSASVSAESSWPVVFDLGVTSSPQPDGQSLYVQAPSASSDAPAAISVSKMAPWSVALLGALGGVALVAIASGKDGILVVNQTWTRTQTLSADANTRLVIDASRLETADPRYELRLSGPGEVQVTGLKSDGVIVADNLLTGTLYVEVADDDQADVGIKILTGSGNTTIQLRDDRDIVYIDTAKLPGLARLTVLGVTGKLVVSNLTAVIDVSGLTGETEIYTTALPAGHPQLKSLAATPSQVSVLTGDSKTSVNSGRSDEIVTVNAAKLGPGDELRTSGQGRFIVTNFADANLVNSATGGLDVTLGNAAMELGLVTLTSSTAATVFNGAMRDGDSINLGGAGAFTVSGLRAELDARSTTGGLIDITTADAGDNRISVASGSGSLNLNGVAAGDRILLDARAMAASGRVTIQGKSDVEVTQLAAGVDARSLSGQLSLSTSGSTSSTMDIKTGSGETAVRVNHVTAQAQIDAQLISTGRKLTTEGVGSVSVTGLGVDLINAAGNASEVTLRRQGPTTTDFAINVTSATSLTIKNGSLAAGDDLLLKGDGQLLTVNGLLADLDATLTTGAVVVDTARLGTGSFGMAIKTGVGDMTVASPTVAGSNLDSINIDATRLDKAGGRLSLSGLARKSVTLAASGAADKQYEIASVGDLEVGAAQGVLSTDSINLRFEGVGAADTIRIISGINRYQIRGLQGSLVVANPISSAAFDVSLYDGAAGLSGSMRYSGKVNTGAGNDHLRFEYEAPGGSTVVPVTPGPNVTGDNTTFVLGAGDNEVHVGRGLAAGATFDLSLARFLASSDAGTNRLVINDGASVKVSSSQLQRITEARRVFSDIREEGAVSDLSSSSPETLVVDTTAGALGQDGRLSYLLDDAIEQWVIGETGGGKNDVTLGKDGQTIRFGAGAPVDTDVVRLSGRSAGDLVGVERIIVGGPGSSISEARVSAAEDPSEWALGPGQMSLGVSIDFADQNGSLKLTIAQHDQIATGGQLDLSGVDSGYQTLVLKNATIDLVNVGSTVSNLQALAGIEVYQLGDASLLAPRMAEILAAPSGSNLTARAFGSPGTVLQAVNDFSQGNDTVLIRGGTGNDAIRTSGDDAKRGALTVDLSSGGQDLVFVNNIWVGNTLNAGNVLSKSAGFGGAIVSYASGTYFANGIDFAETSAIWAAQKPAGALTNPAGTNFARIDGFSTDLTKIDRLAFISDQLGDANAAAIEQPKFMNDISQPISGNLGFSNYVLEFKASYTSTIQQAGQLDRVAALLKDAVGSKAPDGSYYVIIYSGDDAQADAWLYAAKATAVNGFNFSHNQASQVVDQDTLELLAIFTGVGADTFSSSNLAWFASPPVIVNPPQMIFPFPV